MAATPHSGCTAENLRNLLREVQAGQIQLPEFQRHSSLEDDWVRSLLASVSLGYPIGAVTLLEAGDPHMRFASRPLAPGLPSSGPDRLLVDGQQRMTCLYSVLASNQSVQTGDDHNESVRRWYYLDLNAALDPEVDRDVAIVSVPDTGGVPSPDEVTLDSSTAELEWERRLFPLRLVFGSPAERRRWRRGFTEYGAAADTHSRGALMEQLESDVLAAFDEYVVPTIVVGRETTRWSVRVHGGPQGRLLSDRYYVIDDEHA